MQEEFSSVQYLRLPLGTKLYQAKYMVTACKYFRAEWEVGRLISLKGKAKFDQKQPSIQTDYMSLFPSMT